MTKVVLISSFLLMGFLAKAQDFQGKAEYFSKRIMKKKTEKVETKSKEPLDPELQKEIEIAKAQGKKDLVIRSGDIHQTLKMANAMPTVCSAMRTLDGEYKYEVIEEPPKGNGSRLVFKYIFN